MKKKYVKPSINMDVFQANEYIAACFSGKCNVPVSPIGSFYVMYKESNGTSGYQEEEERIRIINDPCNAEFNVKAEGITTYQWDSNGTSEGGTIKDVYYWSDGRTTHVSDGVVASSSSH